MTAPAEALNHPWALEPSFLLRSTLVFQYMIRNHHALNF
jgi:hypothetical protein